MTRDIAIWTPEQDAIVRREWPQPASSARTIGDLVGHPEATVNYRARFVLNLGRKPQKLTPWSPETNAKLRELWARKDIGCREIGLKLGVSKNAVIGQAGRMGLPSRKTQPGPRPQPKPKSPAIQTLRAPPVRKTEPNPLGGKLSHLARAVTNHQPRPAPTPKAGAKPVAIPLSAKVLADLAHCECKWSVGPDPGPGRMDRQLFCAEVTNEGESYCPTHKARAYQASRTPEQRSFDADRAARMRAAKGGAHGVHSHLFPAGRKASAA